MIKEGIPVHTVNIYGGSIFSVIKPSSSKPKIKVVHNSISSSKDDNTNFWSSREYVREDPADK